MKIISLLFTLTLLNPSMRAGDLSRFAGFWTPPDPPRAHYTIDFRIDTVAKRLTGTETVELANEDPRLIRCLAIDWLLTTRQTLGVTAEGVMLPVRSDSGKSPLLVDLPHPIRKGEKAILMIDFSLSLPLLGEQDKMTLTAWFPRLWWGRESHDDFDVHPEIPAGYTLATSGRLDGRTGTYRVRNAVSFGIFLGRGLQVVEAHAGGVLVRCLFSEPGRECALLVLRTAVDAINFYRERCGFYPYTSLDIVPGYDSPVGGYPAATSLSVIHGEERMSEKPEIHWKWITAHEVNHMYWGHYVLEGDSPGWLWIGMGIYGDREYIRARHLSLQMHRDLMARYVDGVRQHLNTTVAITPEQRRDVDFDFNNVVTHGKGYSIISALAQYLGKEKFERIYLRCLRQFGGGRMGLAGFQAVCEEESGEDLSWFFDQWVRSNRFLAYEVTSRQCVLNQGSYLSTISVERTGTLQMPVPVRALFADDSTQQRSTERLLDITVLHFVSTAPLVSVGVDPDSELAMVVPVPQMTKEELVKAVDHLPWTGARKEAVALFTRAQELRPASDIVWFKLGMLLYDGENYALALQAFRSTAEVADSGSSLKFGAFVWQGHVFDVLGRRDEAIQSYKRALNMEAGQELHHGQYDMVINRKWVEDRLRVPFVRR